MVFMFVILFMRIIITLASSKSHLVTYGGRTCLSSECLVFAKGIMVDKPILQLNKNGLSWSRYMPNMVQSFIFLFYLYILFFSTLTAPLPKFSLHLYYCTWRLTLLSLIQLISKIKAFCYFLMAHKTCQCFFPTFWYKRIITKWIYYSFKYKFASLYILPQVSLILILVRIVQM